MFISSFRKEPSCRPHAASACNVTEPRIIRHFVHEGSDLIAVCGPSVDTPNEYHSHLSPRNGDIVYPPHPCIPSASALGRQSTDSAYDSLNGSFVNHSDARLSPRRNSLLLTRYTEKENNNNIGDAEILRNSCRSARSKPTATNRVLETDYKLARRYIAEATSNPSTPRYLSFAKRHYWDTNEDVEHRIVDSINTTGYPPRSYNTALLRRSTSTKGPGYSSSSFRLIKDLLITKTYLQNK